MHMRFVRWKRVFTFSRSQSRGRLALFSSHFARLLRHFILSIYQTTRVYHHSQQALRRALALRWETKSPSTSNSFTTVFPPSSPTGKQINALETRYLAESGRLHSSWAKQVILDFITKAQHSRFVFMRSTRLLNESVLSLPRSQLWLLGYEFPATLFIFTQEAVHIVTTRKKGALLSQPTVPEQLSNPPYA